MTRKKPKGYGYKHIVKTSKKRKGRHSKKAKVTKYRGQGRK